VRIKCKDTGEIARSYAEYLATQHWRLLREKAFIKSDGICMCCKKPLSKNFVCHHKSYKRIGNERFRTLPYSDKFIVRAFQKIFHPDDVIAVCNHCHNGTSKNHEKLHEFVKVPTYAQSNERL